MQFRAFVFDGDPAVRRLVREILERRGYEVHTFAEAYSCQSCDGRACADVIIADAMVGAGSGTDFLLAQRAIGCANQHIALTGASWSDADRANLVRLGCQVFTKPFPTRELRSWLQDVEAKVAIDRRLSDVYLKKVGKETW